MDNITVVAKSRTEFGKKGAKAVRKEGRVPCVLYGGKEMKHFSVHPLDVRSLIYTPSFKTAELDLDGVKIKCIIKKTDFHPVNDTIVHIDFLELVPNQLIKYDIPVAFEGSSPGVVAGGKLLKNIRKVTVKSTPENLVSLAILDVSSLELGAAIRIRDIKPMEGVEVINDSAIPVAIVEVPRALKSETSAADTAVVEAVAE